MRPRLTYANVVSTLALLFALGTGGAWAATQINGSLIKKNTIAGSKIKKSTITHREINEKKLKAVPRAVTADKLAGQDPAAFLPAGGTATNSNQLGGIGPGGFVQGGGRLTSGRIEGTATGSDPNVVRTLSVPQGEFRFSCLPAHAEVRYVNTTAGSADVFQRNEGPAVENVSFDQVAPNGEKWLAVTNANGAHVVEFQVGKGEGASILRAGERRVNANTCVWNWELVQSG
jgi:hypothetical protein